MPEFFEASARRSPVGHYGNAKRNITETFLKNTKRTELGEFVDLKILVPNKLRC